METWRCFWTTTQTTSQTSSCSRTGPWRRAWADPLNAISKVHRAFARAQVSANLSSALNQGGQLPIILAENGARNVAQALIELRSKDLKSWAAGSDFLTEKKGINYIVTGGAEPVFEGGPGREERGGGHAPLRTGSAGRSWQAGPKGSVPLAFRSRTSQPDGAHVPAGGPGLTGSFRTWGTRTSGEMAGKGKQAWPGLWQLSLVKIILGLSCFEPEDRRGAVRRDAGAVRRSGPCRKPFCRQPGADADGPAGPWWTTSGAARQRRAAVRHGPGAERNSTPLPDGMTLFGNELNEIRS